MCGSSNYQPTQHLISRKGTKRARSTERVYYDSTYEPRTYYPALLTSSLTWIVIGRPHVTCPAQRRGRGATFA